MKIIGLTAVDGADLFVGSQHIVMMTDDRDNPGHTEILLSTGAQISVREGFDEVLDIVAGHMRKPK